MQIQSFLRACAALALLAAAGIAVAQAVDTTRRTPPSPELRLRALAAQAVNPRPPTQPTVSNVWLPSFVGQPEEVARRSLQALGGTDSPARLRVLTETQASTAPARTVVRQVPVNRDVPRGSTVTLHVSDGSLVRVPSVQGLDERTARERLHAAGLGANRKEAVTDQPAGEVFLQEPAAKTEVRRGSDVMLTIAVPLPPRLVWVPSQVGKQEKEALSALRELGDDGTSPALQVRAVQRRSVAPAGRVLAQQPANQNVRRGTLVTLDVSDGSLVKVPEVRRFTQAEAVDRLGRGGLRAVAETEVSAQHPPGRVFAQSPPPNEQVDRDSPVTITVAAAVPPPQPAPGGGGGGTGGTGPAPGSGPTPDLTVKTGDVVPAVPSTVRAWYDAPWAWLLAGATAAMLGMGLLRAVRRPKAAAREPVEPRGDAPAPEVHAEWRGPAARPALSCAEGEPMRFSIRVSPLHASQVPQAIVQRREEEMNHA